MLNGDRWGLRATFYIGVNEWLIQRGEEGNSGLKRMIAPVSQRQKERSVEEVLISR